VGSNARNPAQLRLRAKDPCLDRSSLRFAQDDRFEAVMTMQAF